jgi:acyl-CoA synthetase (AMP-forming)/AMP-acid ligase II
MGLISTLDNQSRSADSVVAWYDGGAVDWSRWTREVAALAAHLDRTDKQHWALYCDDSYTFSVGLFGLWSSGRTPVLPPNNTPGTLAALGPYIQGRLGDLEGADACTGHPAPATGSAVKAFAGESSQLMLFTSGSTGDAKRIPKSVRQLESELQILASVWQPLNDATTFISTVSHQHIYGLLFKVLLPLTTGRAFDASILQSPSSVARAAASHSAVAWISSPAQLKRLDPGVVGEAPSQLNCIVSSGGLLDKPAADTASRWSGHAPIEVYGSSESGGVAYRQQHLDAAATPWQPLPDVAIAAADDDGLLVRSTQADGDNWLAMGDAVELFDNGTFALKGRIDRIVKVEEQRVSLEALEARLTALPEITEARTLLIPGERDALAAVVVLSQDGCDRLVDKGKLGLTSGLRTALSEHFDRVTIPRRWRFVPKLPINEQGKILHAELLKHFDNPPATRLPTVEKTEHTDANTAELTLVVPLNLAYLEGHFPGEPILPGVVQILWARHFGQTLLNLPANITQMKKVKFKRLIRPGERIHLRLVYSEAKQQMSFRYQSNLDECSSGVLRG